MLLNILLFRNLLVAAALNGFDQFARHCSRYVCMTDNDVDEEFFRDGWKYFDFTYLQSLAPRVLHRADRPREGFSTDRLTLLRALPYAQRSADVWMPHATSPPLAMQYTVVCRLLGTANESARPVAVICPTPGRCLQGDPQRTSVGRVTGTSRLVIVARPICSAATQERRELR